jgi:formate hydrogenlyase subunit 6/NADH:ubiquinone oxidoreductase subunit I
MKIQNPVVGFINGLMVTIRSALRHPVTAEYPAVEKRLALSDRYMGFPALTWDFDVEEPYCTGCMVCVRECPKGPGVFQPQGTQQSLDALGQTL